jgi:hypothetical protein
MTDLSRKAEVFAHLHVIQERIEAERAERAATIAVNAMDRTRLLGVNRRRDVRLTAVCNRHLRQFDHI